MSQVNKICTRGLSLKIPEKLHSQLSEDANSQGISMASVVKIILTNHYKQLEDTNVNKKGE